MNTRFAEQLARFGPRGWHRPLSSGEAHVYCAQLTRSHYENFTIVSWLLPRALVRHFHAVYAYCRWADDLADEVHPGSEFTALELLQWWRTELERCYDGRPRHPVFLALRETITRFQIPPEPFLDLLSAFEQDQRVKRYRTYVDLLDYCRRSANPVGRLILYLGEVFDAKRAQYSDHICTGLQLTNFWQDVARDLDLGRVYLPEEDRVRFGYSDADLEARRFTSAFSALMEFEVNRAREHFERGSPLIADLPKSLQMDVELFACGGQAVLDRIEAEGYDVWSVRPTLTRWRKGRLMLSLLWQRFRPRIIQSL